MDLRPRRASDQVGSGDCMNSTLATVAEAKHHCRIDTDADDGWLEMVLVGVTRAIEQWVQEADRVWILDTHGDRVLDTHGDPVPEPNARIACLLEVASQYRSRDGTDTAQVPAHWGHGYILSHGATAMLAGLRRSTVQ